MICVLTNSRINGEDFTGKMHLCTPLLITGGLCCCPFLGDNFDVVYILFVVALIVWGGVCLFLVLWRGSWYLFQFCNHFAEEEKSCLL